MTARVAIRSVSKQFEAFTALSGVSLDIAAGEYIVLLGPSGCGKTTLLSILGGFLTPSSGTVEIGDKDVTELPPARRPTTTMFQDYALFPHMTVRDNVAFGPRMRGVGRAERRRKAEGLLKLVGLEGAAARKPSELSGGQRQRVALARALAVDPDVLLLDEPLGALDLKLRRQMQDELKAIQQRVGTTFVHVTHDQEEAMAIADRIVVMNRGRIEDVGPPADVYLRPRSHFAANFMGEINMIAGRLARIEGTRIGVETELGAFDLPGTALTAGPLALGAAVAVGIRPEAFRTPGEGAAPLGLGASRIVDCAFFGTHYRCHLAPDTAPGVTLVAHLPQAARPIAGGSVPLQLDATQVVVLPAPVDGG